MRTISRTRYGWGSDKGVGAALRSPVRLLRHNERSLLIFSLISRKIRPTASLMVAYSIDGLPTRALLDMSKEIL
jgi:hypothetical protein